MAASAESPAARAVFPRIDRKKKQEQPQPKKSKKKKKEPPKPAEISIDKFAEVDLRVADPRKMSLSVGGALSPSFAAISANAKIPAIVIHDAGVTLFESGAILLYLAEKFDRFEFPILIVLATLGMMLMVSANSLLTLYMGLELQSLALYVVASLRRDSVKSTEAGLKYFVLGALSSGLLLYGASLVYGYTG